MSANKNSAETRKKKLFGIGLAMGTADLVPGVSGGTMAFIFGIYEQLIESVKIVTGAFLKATLSLKFKQAWRLFPASFILPLAFGILIAIFSLASLVSYLLDTQAMYVWGFFFGLIIGSIFLVRNRIKSWGWQKIVALLLGAVITFIIAGLTSSSEEIAHVYLFFAGAIAFCAMILPGISGSLILILLGAYDTVLRAAAERNIVPLLFLAAGGLVGLALFSRVLSWLLKHYHDVVVAFLIGMMIGSLRKVWPWQTVDVQNAQSVTYSLPDSIVSLLSVVILAGIGYLIILRLEKATTSELKK